MNSLRDRRIGAILGCLLIILLTALGNALLNAMLAPLLGLNISLRQSLLAILMSFAIAAGSAGNQRSLATLPAAAVPLVALAFGSRPPRSRPRTSANCMALLSKVTARLSMSYIGPALPDCETNVARASTTKPAPSALAAVAWAATSLAIVVSLPRMPVKAPSRTNVF